MSFTECVGYWTHRDEPILNFLLLQAALPGKCHLSAYRLLYWILNTCNVVMEAYRSSISCCHRRCVNLEGQMHRSHFLQNAMKFKLCMPSNISQSVWANCSTNKYYLLHVHVTDIVLALPGFQRLQDVSIQMQQWHIV